MKGTERMNDYNELLTRARALFDALTPLNIDCGELCARACCAYDTEVGGAVALFPGEEKLLEGRAWARIVDYRLPVSGVRTRALICEGGCERELRPLCCRIFPLTLAYSRKKARWTARVDRRAFMICPLAPSGVKGLKPEFARAAVYAARLLASDARAERILKALAIEENAYRISLYHKP